MQREIILIGALFLIILFLVKASDLFRSAPLESDASKFVLEDLKNKYPNLILDISYLEKPEFLKADIATERELLKIIEANEYMQSSNIFSQYEKSKLSMVIGLLRKSIKEPSHLLSYYRSDFFSFISEYDRRFQLNFLKTFPEAESFYNLAKKHYLFENSKK